MSKPVSFSTADKAQRAAAVAAATAAVRGGTAAAAAAPISQYSSVEARVNAWLRDDCDGDISPLEALMNVANMFLDDVERFDLALGIETKRFKHNLCQGLGAFYRAAERRVSIKGPTEIQNPPRGWNDDAEFIWTDYISHMYFSEKYWTSFWDDVPTMNWESVVPGWRVFLQSIMPFYLARDPELLMEESLLMQNSEGLYISPDAEEDFGEPEDD
jgi:hypothetical protein